VSEYTIIVGIATKVNHTDPADNSAYILGGRRERGDKAVTVYSVPTEGVCGKDLYAVIYAALLKLESICGEGYHTYIVVDAPLWSLMLSDPQYYTVIAHSVGEVKLFGATVLQCKDVQGFDDVLYDSLALCNFADSIDFDDFLASKKAIKAENVDSDSVQAVTDTDEPQQYITGESIDSDAVLTKIILKEEPMSILPPTAKKETIGKLRYDLLPISSLEELCKVYTYGVEKYGVDNWKIGLSYMTCFGSIIRHLFEWVQGVDVDRESGCKHLAHVAWWCFALMWYARKGKGVDDRDKSLPREVVDSLIRSGNVEGTE
jgi:hypothetical protein